jgi:hypothetical protein
MNRMVVCISKFVVYTEPKIWKYNQLPLKDDATGIKQS